MTPQPCPILFSPHRYTSPLNWERVFGRPGPVEIEVGCGKGRFLRDQASLHPGSNFLGLEYARAYLVTLAKRAERQALTNLRCSKMEAAEFFRDWVADRSVDSFHLLYPDPWPKTRHHKRRLIQHPFLEDLRRTLKPGAQLNLATDHADYFEWMLDHFEAWKGTFVMTARVLKTQSELQSFTGRTNYEIKYAAEGRPLHLLQGYRTSF